MRPSWRVVVVWLSMIAAFALFDVPAQAERPPTRLYTSADGLPVDDIVKIRADSQGFLWFATPEGASRFDGVQFVSYGRRDGLPVAAVNDILETREGQIWIATNGGGIARVNAEPHGGDRLFTIVTVGPDRASNRVNVLVEDVTGRFWAATDSGLYRSTTQERTAFELVALSVPGVPDRLIAIPGMVLGGHRDLWLATSHGVMQVFLDGGTTRYVAPPSARLPIAAIWRDDKGVIWMGGGDGLLAARERPDPGPSSDAVEWQFGCTSSVGTIRMPTMPGNLCQYGTSDGVRATEIRALHRGAEGRLLIGATDGHVWECDGQRFRSILEPADSGSPLNTVASDAEGNSWVGTRLGGFRIAEHGFVSFDGRDGLSPNPKAFVEDDGGGLYALSREWRINRFEGGRFVSYRPPLPAGVRPTSWSNQSDVRDDDGHWWVGTGQGLYRYRSSTTANKPLTFEPVARYSIADGLPGDDILALYVDSRDDVWVAATSTQGDDLARWDRRSGTFQRFGTADGVPSFSIPVSFIEDGHGSLWVALRSGGVLRYRANRFERFGEEAGFVGPSQCLFVDRAGRLWVGTLDGVVRVDRPDESRIRTRQYTTADGLASDGVRGVAEDRQGQLYIATSRGVSRLDPDTDAFEQFTTSDGLSSENIFAVHADRDGRIWFATPEGLSRLSPRPTATAPAPSVRIASVRIAGVPHPVSPFGAGRVEGLSLDPGENLVEVDFFGLARGARGVLRYQYQLDGASPTWSPPREQRTLNFANLASGSYRLLVRAVTATGVTSAQPAVLSFVVLPPIYLRWWFIVLAGALVVSAGVALYRMRVAHLVRVERVRGRIATDLHDDIGASLSQIAILAEVARQRAGAERADPGVADPLARIADTSRGLVDSMSDIVWAINPSADSLGDLIHRMRRFAEDTLSADEIELRFRAEEPRVDVVLGADLRREVFLILKESVTNIAKHAECTRVEIDVDHDRRRLRLRVTDNGAGFDLTQHTDGNGLRSMRQRAAAMGGRLDVMSSSSGSTVLLEVTLGRGVRPGDAEERAH